MTISTGHVGVETAKTLDDAPCAHWLCVAVNYAECGRFFYAYDENAGEGNEFIPDDLFAAMTWARQNGFSDVLLDRDAEKADDLPLHDW